MIGIWRHRTPPHRPDEVVMQVRLMKTRCRLYSLAALILFVLPCGSAPAVAAGDGEAFIVLPGEPPRYGGQQGREADITELWRPPSKPEVCSASFVRPSRLRAVPLRTCTEWKLSSVKL